MTCACNCRCEAPTSARYHWPPSLCDDCQSAPNKMTHCIYVEPRNRLPDDVPKVLMWGTDPFEVSIADLEARFEADE